MAGDDDDGGDPDPDGRRRRNTPPPPLSRHPAPASPERITKPARLLRLPEVKVRCGLSRSTIYQRIKDGTFPPALSIGPRSVAWIESAIDGWIAAQILASSASE
ncbi:MAG: AlpA family transcriptional regulator [Cupriavidus sp.]|nr:AlpA family transcriptional regulator [Cupriavidus sp.]